MDLLGLAANSATQSPALVWAWPNTTGPAYIQVNPVVSSECYRVVCVNVRFHWLQGLHCRVLTAAVALLGGRGPIVRMTNGPSATMQAHLGTTLPTVPRGWSPIR